MYTKLLFAIFFTGLSSLLYAQSEDQDPKLTEVWDPEPKIVNPGTDQPPPSDAIVLFGGKDLSQWESPDGSSAPWVVKDGYFTVKPKTGSIQTKEGFGDIQLHIEWRSPEQVNGNGQGRGNSGVFIMNKYEVQILDSYNNRTYANGQAGSVYKQHSPLVNASRKPGEWQSYDIIFWAPRFELNGDLLAPAYVTVFHNGVLIQNHVEIEGTTVFRGEPSYKKHAEKAPISLQDHGNPVSFRNIWVREL